VIYVKWFYFEVKCSEVIYAEVLGDKSAMYISVLVYIVTISLGYILYCGCFNLLRNVWVFW